MELPEYLRCAKKLGLSRKECEAIVDLVATAPDSGSEISGTGGLRKLRIAGMGKGKSGGYRVITFFSGVHIPVFLVTIDGKNKKDNLTEAEKKTLKLLTESIVEIYRRINHE